MRYHVDQVPLVLTPEAVEEEEREEDPRQEEHVEEEERHEEHVGEEEAIQEVHVVKERVK